MRHVFDIVMPAARTAEGADGGWTIFAINVRGQIESLQGNEMIKAQAIVDNVTHKITMRYMAGITSKMWIAFNGRKLQITSPVNPDERTRMLVLYAFERDPQGT